MWGCTFSRAAPLMREARPAEREPLALSRSHHRGWEGSWVSAPGSACFDAAQDEAQGHSWVASPQVRCACKSKRCHEACMQALSQKIYIFKEQKPNSEPRKSKSAARITACKLNTSGSVSHNATSFQDFVFSWLRGEMKVAVIFSTGFSDPSRAEKFYPELPQGHLTHLTPPHPHS